MHIYFELNSGRDILQRSKRGITELLTTFVRFTDTNLFTVLSVADVDPDNQSVEYRDMTKVKTVQRRNRMTFYSVHILAVGEFVYLPYRNSTWLAV